MKKLIRSIAMILVLVLILSLNVSAAMDGSEDPFINFLDYGSINGTGSNYVEFKPDNNLRGEFTFNFDVTTQPSYIDFVIRCTGAYPSSIAYKNASSYYTLTFTSIGSNMYRVYGSVGFTSGVNSITFRCSGFTSSTSVCKINIISFKGTIGGYTQIADTTHMTIENYETKSQQSATMPSAGSSVSMTIVYSDDPLQNAFLYPFDLYAYFDDWKKYDYGQISLKIQGLASLNSIAVQLDGSYIPFEVSYLDVNASDGVNQFREWKFTGTDTVGGCYYYNEDSVVYLNIRADFSALKRSSSGVPMIRLYGQQAPANQVVVSLLSYDGIIVQEGPGFMSRLSFMWRENYALFSAGFDDIGHIVGTGFDSLGQKIDELPDKIAEAMSSVFQPSAGKMEQMQQQSQELAQERLGAVYQVVEIVDGVAGAFTVQEAQGTIMVPACTVMLSNVPFTFGGWEVQVVPSGFEELVEVCKYIIDIVCTLAFVNGMKSRFEEFLGGGSGAG